MSGKQTPENHDVNPHREHQLYEYYTADLLAHAEATKANNEQSKQEKTDHTRDEK